MTDKAFNNTLLKNIKKALDLSPDPVCRIKMLERKIKREESDIKESLEEIWG